MVFSRGLDRGADYSSDEKDINMIPDKDSTVFNIFYFFNFIGIHKCLMDGMFHNMVAQKKKNSISAFLSAQHLTK